MRRALFAIILVGAAFAGGAAINGPGLERLKALVKARIDAATAPPSPNPGPGFHRPDEPRRDVPAAPQVPLGDLLARDDPSPIPPPASLLSDAPPAATPPLIPPGDRTVIVAAAIDPPPVVAPPAGLPVLEPPSVTPPATPEDEPTASGPAPAAAPARDWPSIRRRMRVLGVSRYELEGTPEGRARFRCLIPLAGKRAVGQQFEGEGDDDLAAAEAALRRVALWRATEVTPP